METGGKWEKYSSFVWTHASVRVGEEENRYVRQDPPVHSASWLIVACVRVYSILNLRRLVDLITILK